LCVFIAPFTSLIVVSSGLVNPAAVYSAVEQNRLAKAKLSDKTVFIRTEEEVAALANSTSTKTWHYKLKNARICLGHLQRHL
jgi:biotin synthase-related radical SAM superfamily protein